MPEVFHGIICRADFSTTNAAAARWFVQWIFGAVGQCRAARWCVPRRNAAFLRRSQIRARIAFASAVQRRAAVAVVPRKVWSVVSYLASSGGFLKKSGKSFAGAM